MRKPPPSRKAALKAALAYAGQTMDAWCDERGVTHSHVYRVLRGKRESARLIAEIDDYIAKHTRIPMNAA